METTQTSLERYLNIVSTNQMFNDYQQRWQFYLESYLGGEEYRQAGHLVQYQLETNQEYQIRLNSTPLDNHCKSIISTYISFLFRESPHREFGSLEENPMVEDFCYDADLEGRSICAFMKDASIWAGVFGHCWVLVTRPAVGAATLADQIQMGSRPYVNLLTPLTVLDWKWSRSPTGRYELTYMKYIEEVNDTLSTIKEWTMDEIITTVVDNKERRPVEEFREANGLGMVPAVQIYSTRSPVRGIGSSDLSDIADQQRAIYNEYSEIEQLIRLQNHPALVKTADTEAGAGAGAIIMMPDNIDPGLKPFLLEPNGNGLQHIYESISARVAAIDKMAHTSGVRTTKTQSASGVALQTEFALLNSKLSEKADQLELAEEQIWNLFAAYMGVTFDGEITYPDSFDIRDEEQNFANLKMAKDTATDPVVLRVVDEQLMELLGEEKARLPFIDPNPQTGRTYSDGEAIPDSLPNAYVPETDPMVPAGQNCGNCEYYKPGELYCMKFDAPVRAVYWCAKWSPAEENY
jgi:hypothetical protein